MPVKVKGLKGLGTTFRKVIPKIKKNFSNDLKGEIVDIIVEKITSGSSPVAPGKRYKDYSPEYAKVKGRKSPVDFVVTGDLLNGMRATQNSEGDVKVEFVGGKRNKIASAHQFGDKQRKLLPASKGEEFTKKINSKILKILEKAVKKSTK